MKQKIKFLLHSFFALFDYRFDPVLLMWHFKHSQKLLKFKDKHKGESCFIIGNGPSLNRMELSRLHDFHTFGLNKIYLMFDKVDLNLSYHVAINNLVIEQSARNFEQLKCPCFLEYQSARKYVNPKKHIYYIANGGFHISRPNLANFQRHITGLIRGGGTVTYAAMQIAYFMGFQNVILIGVDHHFKTDGDPHDVQILKGPDSNHFDSSYFADQNWQLPDLKANELSYHLAKFYFENDGRKIYDATVDGKLNVFTKITYDEALSLCNKKHL